MWYAYVVGFFIVIFIGVMCVYREVYGEIFTNSKVRMGYVAVKRLTIAYRICRHRHIRRDRRLLSLLRQGSEVKYINIRYKYCRPDGPAFISNGNLERQDEIYATGIILYEDGCNISTLDCQTVTDLGYSVFTFPSISHAITAVYAISNPESLTSAVRRIYPVVEQIITAHRLCAYPQFEIYNRNHIQIIIPLSRQICYFVPEAVPRSPYHWYLNSVQPTNEDLMESNQ